MGYKIIFIEKGTQIRYQLDALIISLQQEEIRISLSDIDMMVVDNLKTKISSRALCELANQNIGVIICNQKHLPTGLFTGFDNHSRAPKIFEYQLGQNDESRHRFWSKIIKSKISNQAKALVVLEKSQEAVEKLNVYKNQITSGDITNREAHSAKVYFNALMGQSFSRGNSELLLNSGLDYGYTIIRSYLVKLCTGYGLNTMLSIHHKNEYNKFSLADDLIEPVRPIVDIFTYNLMSGEEFFCSEHRRSLVNLLNHMIYYRGKKQYLSNALDMYVSGYVAGIKNGDLDNLEFFDVDQYLGEIL